MKQWVDIYLGDCESIIIPIADAATATKESVRINKDYRAALGIKESTL